MNKPTLIILLIAASWLAGYLSPPLFGEDEAAPSSCGGDTPPAPENHPPIWRPEPVRLAREGAEPIGMTCDVISLNGRSWGVPFWLLDRPGTQCHKVIGAPEDPDMARLCPTASKPQS